MKRLFHLALLAASALIAWSSLAFGDGVTARDAWIAAPPKGAAVAAGYLRLANDGDEARRIVAAAADFADRAELHTMTLEDGVMRMSPLPEGIALAPAAEVILAPGGDHIMFMGLTRPLAVGETASAKLTLESGAVLDVVFDILPTGSRGPSP